jgi:membrane protease YdiL (CAAX protease family)
VNESFPSPETPPPEVISARPIELHYGRPLEPPSPLMLPMISRRAAVLDLLLVLLVGLGVLIGISLMLRMSAPAGSDELEPINPNLLLVQEWFQTLAAAAVLAYLVMRHELPLAAFGIRSTSLGRQFAWGAVGLGLTYAWLIISLIVITAFLLLFPGAEEDLMKRRELLRLLPIDSLWRTIALMIPVAISEELIFRGLLLPYLRRLTGAWWAAVLISTGVFAALHFPQGLIGVFQISGVALIFALVFIHSRSLTATIVAHFGFNVGQVLFMRFAQDVLKDYGF